MALLEMNGMDELLAQLQRTAQNVTEVKKKALMAGAEIIRDEIEARAPVDTGELKTSIVISQVQSSEKYIDVGPSEDAYWAKWQEFGSTKQAAKPFIEPAFLTKRREAQAAMRDVIKEAIDSG